MAKKNKSVKAERGLSVQSLNKKKSKNSFGKQEALKTTRLISEKLTLELGIPSSNIVNDTTFSEYTGTQRPDLLISTNQYNPNSKNQKKEKDHFIKGVVFYCEIKDDCSLYDENWKDAERQALDKSKKLNLPYYAISNLKITKFFNLKGQELSLNNEPISDFKDLNVLKTIYKALSQNNSLTNIGTDSEIKNSIKEKHFIQKLAELEKIYRSLSFDNITDKIDFTIGFISLKFFEEKQDQDLNDIEEEIIKKTKQIKDDSSKKLVLNNEIKKLNERKNKLMKLNYGPLLKTTLLKRKALLNQGF